MCFICFFFFKNTATTEIHPLPLPRRSPDLGADRPRRARGAARRRDVGRGLQLPLGAARAIRARAHRVGGARGEDRKSTRLNSSHANISYAVFCLKKKKIKSQAFVLDNILSH